MSQALVALARGVAVGAHAGRVDMLGQPQIAHVARVACRVKTFEQQILAWLHDVLADTKVMAEDLAAAGFPESIVVEVEAMTRRPKESAETLYRRVCAWPDARAVMFAEVADNSSLERLGSMDKELQRRFRGQYTRARKILEDVSH